MTFIAGLVLFFGGLSVVFFDLNPLSPGTTEIILGLTWLYLARKEDKS